MKAGSGVVCAAPRATSLLLSHCRPKLRTLSFSSSSSFSGHIGFIKDVAATQPPKHLSHLLRMLKIKGDSIISPGAKQGMIPLAIPLAKNSSDAVIGLLRWPTAPPGMEMPVVEVRNHGVWLLAKTVDQFIHRILVEEDANNSSIGNHELFHAAVMLGRTFTQRVGLFPDILERKAMHHFQKGDHVSALVTGEFYAKKEHFPGFARPFVFNAEVLLKIGRKLEAKDAARGALKSPWWTLGWRYQEVAQIAQWEYEQIEYIKEKMTEEGRQEDLNKGKEPVQIALDEAAFLLDSASVDGTWDDTLKRIAECYKEAGLYDVAKFVEYRD